MKRPFLYAALLLLTQCSKCKTDDPQPKTELEKLPPATQQGRTSFGCLVNGQAWTPKGGAGLAPNYSIYYEPNDAGGTLQVRALRYLDGNGIFQAVSLGGIRIHTSGTYPLKPGTDRSGSFTDHTRAFPCNEYRSADMAVRCRGTLTITRLDLQARVIAGTFEFTLAKPGCDTIKVTHGRFDYPL